MGKVSSTSGEHAVHLLPFNLQILPAQCKIKTAICATGCIVALHSRNWLCPINSKMIPAGKGSSNGTFCMFLQIVHSLTKQLPLPMGPSTNGLSQPLYVPIIPLARLSHHRSAQPYPQHQLMFPHQASLQPRRHPHSPFPTVPCYREFPTITAPGILPQR